MTITIGPKHWLSPCALFILWGQKVHLGGVHLLYQLPFFVQQLGPRVSKKKKKQAAQKYG